MKFKLVESISQPTEEEILKAIEELEDKDDCTYITDDVESGSTLWLTSDGIVIDCEDYDTHSIFMEAVEDASTIQFTVSLAPYAEENLGWLTLNSGFGYGDERFKITMIKRPTAEQIKIIENWLNYYCNIINKENLIVYCDGKQKTYDLENYTPKDIIKSINKSFMSGMLENK